MQQFGMGRIGDVLNNFVTEDLIDDQTQLGRAERAAQRITAGRTYRLDVVDIHITDTLKGRLLHRIHHTRIKSDFDRVHIPLGARAFKFIGRQEMKLLGYRIGQQLPADPFHGTGAEPAFDIEDPLNVHTGDGGNAQFLDGTAHPFGVRIKHAGLVFNFNAPGHGYAFVYDC